MVKAAGNMFGFLKSAVKSQKVEERRINFRIFVRNTLLIGHIYNH